MPKAFYVALGFFAIAFTPITLADHGIITPGPIMGPVVAWCLLGLPLGMIALIAAMPDGVDER
jgi:hypothetical protein